MKNTKNMGAHSLYESPEAELLEVRFEEHLLDGSPFNSDNNQKFIIDDDEEEFYPA